MVSRVDLFSPPFFRPFSVFVSASCIFFVAIYIKGGNTHALTL
jgi:hypothetical protein